MIAAHLVDTVTCGFSPASGQEALWLRYAQRKEHFGPDFFVAVARDPWYLTDTGLRRSPEPAAFFDLHAVRRLETLAIASCSFLPDPVAARICRKQHHMHRIPPLWEWPAFASADIERLTQQLSWAVNTLGAWDVAYTLLDQMEGVSTQVGEAGLPLLAELCGNIAAAHCDTRCRHLYGLAVQSASTPVDRAFLWLRIATAETKRLSNLDRAREALLRLSECTADCDIQTQPLLTALTLNLHALVAITGRDDVDALALIRRAGDAINEDDNSGQLAPDVSARHRVQVWTNLGTMTAVSGDSSAAVGTLERVVAYARRCHRESLSESLSILGLLQLRSGSRRAASRALAEADEILEQEANPVRHREVLRLRALVEADMGHSEATIAGLLQRAQDVLDGSISALS